MWSIIIDFIKQFSFYNNCDRIGPDIPTSHWRLYSKVLMRKLCKKKLGGFGEFSDVRPGVYIEACSKVFIGKMVTIRPGTFLFADPRTNGGCIKIEDKVLIGPNVMIFTNNHKFESKNIPIYDQGYPEPSNNDSVTLKEGCWIGAGSIILAGVTVGENAVIGAGSIVTKSVPKGEIWFGNPAKNKIL